MEDDGVTPKPTPALAPKIDEALLKSALCKTAGHSAAYSKCPIKMEYISNMYQPREAIHQSRGKRPPKLNSNHHYPDALPQSSSHALQTATHKYPPAFSSPNYLPQVSLPVWGPNAHQSQKLLDVDEAMSVFNELTDALLQCTDYRQQINVIARLSLQFVRKYQNSHQQP